MHTIEAFDILFLLTNVQTSFGKLTHIFEKYGIPSNLKINYTKSEPLNVNQTSRAYGGLGRLKSELSFKWNDFFVLYLGIKLPSDPSKLFQFNFDNPI